MRLTFRSAPNLIIFKLIFKFTFYGYSRAVYFCVAFAVTEKEFWYRRNSEELKSSMEKYVLNTNVAKNLVLAIGDGMGVSTTTGKLKLKR